MKRKVFNHEKFLKDYFSNLGKKGGASKSEAKQKASRKNLEIGRKKRNERKDETF